MSQPKKQSDQETPQQKFLRKEANLPNQEPQEKLKQDQPKPKLLSQKEVKAKRQTFKALHHLIKNLDIYEGQSFADAFRMTIESQYEEHKKKIGVKGLMSKVKVDDDTIKEALKITEKLTVEEAIGYSQVLKNAIEHHKYQKTKDWKVKDLKIKLL